MGRAWTSDSQHASSGKAVKGEMIALVYDHGIGEYFNINQTLTAMVVVTRRYQIMI